MQSEQLVEDLQSAFLSKRTAAVKALSAEKNDEEEKPSSCLSVHYRSVYSGFDYTPSMAAYKSAKSGDLAAGLIDYASLKGAKEFVAACRTLGVDYVIGTGLKTDFDGRRLTLLALGVPLCEVKAMHKSLAAARALKAKYVNVLRENINAKCGKFRLYLPPTLKIFKKAKADSAENLYKALAEKIARASPDEESVKTFLTENLGFTLSAEDGEKLSDKTSALYLSDLATVLREGLGFKDMREKVAPAQEFVSMAKKFGAIPAAVYDGSPVTDFLTRAKKLGVKCVCIEPDKRQTDLRDFYDKAISAGILPLARKVLDRPRKKVTRPQTDEETFALYRECSLAVCGHQYSVNTSRCDGLFSEKTINSLPDLKARIKLFSKISEG